MPRSIRKSSAYTPEVFESALSAVLTAQLNVKQASDKFKIPYETLRRKAELYRKQFQMNP